MDELISRAFMKSLGAKCIATRDERTNELIAIIGIDELPSAQSEIVRCKDCKHSHLDGMIWNCPFGLSGGEDFFCAYGAKDSDSDDE